MKVKRRLAPSAVHVATDVDRASLLNRAKRLGRRIGRLRHANEGHSDFEEKASIYTPDPLAKRRIKDGVM